MMNVEKNYQFNYAPVYVTAFGSTEFRGKTTL